MLAAARRSNSAAAFADWPFSRYATASFLLTSGCSAWFGKRVRKSSSVLIAPSQSLIAISAAAESYCALARTAEPADATVPTRAKLAAASWFLPPARAISACL